ncbi:MAG: electron transfer flavoprotein subunit alpha/FixB family protein [Deltaproteobacteria bacterium]|nr:electron transfer flavoprotein subunit alpha/FixB family protein [Deltaproteobacteria bacterium]
MNQGVWVIVEHRGGELLDVSLEVLSEMKRVAEQLNEDVSAVLMGVETEGMVNPIGSYGVRQVYLLRSGLFENYCSTLYTYQLVELINRYHPRLVVAGATSSSQDYFPRVSVLMKAGLVTNCSLFTVKDDGRIQLSKPMYGGKVYANIAVKDNGIIMATVRPGTFSKGDPHETPEAQVIEVDPISIPEPIPIRRVGHIKADPKTVDVSEAEMILAGGRGLGNKEGFESLEELAELLGASVGGSRPAVDNQWTIFDRQIGQSGKTVAPRVYIACGISGSSYHVMGMKDSKLIIAINKDGKAPFFRMADVGVVGDANEIIDHMIRVIRQKSKQGVSTHE